MLVIGVAMMATVQQIVISHRAEIRDAQKAFAYQKAMALVSELQVAVDRGRIADSADLDALAHAEPNPVLTTTGAQQLTPDHPMSGNISVADGAWRWARTIEIEEIPEIARIRYARVRILRRDRAGNYIVEASAGSVLSLPTVSSPSVKEYDVYLLAIANAPSLWMPLPELRAHIESTVSGIEQTNPNLRFNLHWITKLGYGRNLSYTPFINAEASAASAAPYAYWYPGKLAEGQSAARLFSPELFSGRVRTESGILRDYDEGNNPFPHAVSDRWNHCMREPAARELFKQRVIAGLEKADEPPLQLLLEDMHRKPELYRNAIVLNLHGSGLPFPPLRNYSDPAKLNEVRVVSHPTRLHVPASSGQRTLIDLASEMDTAASQTTGFIQTHFVDAAGMLRQADVDSESQSASSVNATLDAAIAEIDHTILDGYPDESQVLAWIAALEDIQTLISQGSYAASSGGAALDVRVYAYKSDPALGNAVMSEPITLKIKGVDLTSSVNGTNPSLIVRRAYGGINVTTGNTGTVAETRDYERVSDVPAGIPPRKGEQSEAFEMHYDYGFVASPEPYTWIKLYNTPLVTPQRTPEGQLPEGLSAEKRLYGLEYVPSPIKSDKPFTIDLDHGGDVAKNTTRWLISVPVPSLFATLGTNARRIEIETRIGDDLTTGRQWPVAHQPENLSTTYAWYAANANAVPLTERFQMQGDPRHNPYIDLLEGGPFAHGYNCYFDDLRTSTQDATSEYPCLSSDRLKDGFGSGAVRLDVPRALQAWRTALQTSSAVFVNAGGVPFSQILIGGEICLPPSSGSITPTAVKLAGSYCGSSGTIDVNSVIAEQGGETLAAAGGVLRDSGQFWTKPWIGELYDSAQATTWLSAGNIETGTSPGQLYYQPMHLVGLAKLPTGTEFIAPCSSQLGQLGNASVVQIGHSNDSIVHDEAWLFESLTLTEAGQDILAAAGISDMSAAAGAPSSGGALPEALPQTAWSTTFPMQSASILEMLSIDANERPGVKISELASPVSNQSAFFVMVSELPRDANGHRRLAQRALIFGLRGLHEAGVSAFGHDVAQVPSIEVLQPSSQQKFENPSSIEVRWKSTFGRFDGKPFSPRFPAEYSGNDSSLQYSVVYSIDGGSSWRYASSGDPVNGTVPTEEWINDMAPGDESFLLFTPAARVPAGELRVRIYAREDGRRIHLARHEAIVDITR